jgi:hypothetical protein
MAHCVVFPQRSLLTLCEKQAMGQSGWKHRFALIFFAYFFLSKKKKLVGFGATPQKYQGKD